MFTPSDYAPSERGQQEIQKSSLLGTVAKTALSFVAYGVGLRVSKGLAFKANAGIGTFLTKLAGKNSNQSQAISRAFSAAKRKASPEAIKSFDRLEKKAKQGRRLLRSAVTNIKTSMHATVKPLVDEGRYSQRATKFIDRLQTKLGTGHLPAIARTEKGMVKDIRLSSIVANTDKFKSSAFGKMIHGLNKDLLVSRKHKNVGTFALLKNSSKLSSREAASVIRGRAYNYGSYLSSIAAVDYGIYNLTMPSDKKWYNPKKIGEWAAFTVTSDLAMRSAMPNAKALAGLIGKGVKKGASTKFGRNLLKGVLSSADRISTSQTLVAANRSFDKLAATSNRANNAGGQLIKNIKGYSKAFSSIKLELNNMKKNKSQPGEFMQSALDSLGEFEKSTNISSKAVAMKQTLARGVDKAAAKNDPNKWANRLADTFQVNLKSTLEKNNKVIGPKKVWKGSGHVTMDGKEYDLSNLMPGSVASKAFSFLHDNISIGPFKPLSIFGLKPVINASRNKMALYTNVDDGFVDIGPGYSLEKIDQRLSAIATDNDARKILANDINDSTEGEFIKLLHKKAKDFKDGKFGKGGADNQKEMYENIQRLSTEAKDLENAKQFVTKYTELHGPSAKSEYQSGQKGLHETLLRRGLLKLDSDDEFAMSIGNKMYYGARDGQNNWKTYQLSYDTDKAQYHQLVNIPKGSAEGLKTLSMISRPFEKDTYLDSSGARRNIGAGFSTATTHRTVPQDAGFFTRAKALAADKLELGNKPERSIFEMVGDYFTKNLHPKQMRVIKHSIDTDPNYLARLKDDHADLSTFVSRNHTLANKMDVQLVSKLSNNASVVNAYDSVTKSQTVADGPYSNMFNRFKENDNIFITEKLMDLPTDQVNNIIKNNASELINNLNDVVRGTNAPLYARGGIKEINPSEIEFLNKIVRHRNPIAFLEEAADGYGQLSNKAVYNNLTFRTWFNGIDQGDKSSIINKLQSLPGMSTHRQNLEMLEVSDTINMYKNISHADLGRMDIKLEEYLGEKTVNSIKSYKKGMSRMIDSMEPTYAPSDLHDNIKYPNANYQPLNVAISLNKDFADNSIYSFGEQLMRRSKDFLGNKTGTVQTFTSMQTSQALNAINNTGNMLGIGFNQDAVNTVEEFGKRLLFKRILPAMGIASAYNVADAFFDESGLFEGTQLGEGLDPLMANVIGQSRLAIAGINDVVGVTATAKYLEDIMPGFVSSPLSNMIRGVGAPLAGLSYGTKFGGPTGGLIGGAIGAGISLITAGGPMGSIGQFDISKSRAELIEEYSGRRETPVYKGAGWLFGMGPVKGQKIERFQPSWFHQMTSQYKNTDVLYGSKVERLLAPFDSDHYFEKHQVTRPYPVTENRFAGTPIVGRIIGTGGTLANEQELKYAAMANSLTGGDLNMSNSIDVSSGLDGGGSMNDGPPSLDTLSNMAGGMYVPSSPGMNSASVAYGNRNMPVIQMPGSFAGRAQEAFAQTSDLFGLRGFITESVIEAGNDGLMPYEDIPKYESASWMSSPFRAYWDAELGDMFGTNELIRRFIPKHGKFINEVNPIANNMPMWLAGAESLKDLGTGDIYSKIKKGELRLPGAGYEATHSVNFNVPLETKYLGRSTEQQIAMMTGNYLETEDERLERYIKPGITSAITQQLTLANNTPVSGKSVFNVQSNMSGKIDIAQGRTGTNIHVVSSRTFNQIGSSPLAHHAAEMNASLLMGKMNYGKITYYNAETGQTKDTHVSANQTKFASDMNSLMSSKGVARQMIDEMGPGAGFNMANAYSRVDRLAILGDVAPYSDQFRTTMSNVKSQQRAGLLSQWDEHRLKNIQTQREMKMDRYLLNDYRFNRGTAVTEQEEQYQDYIKDSYSSSERAVGSMWEKFSHLQNPINAKLLNHYSTVEAYERMELYGKQMRDWGDPYGAFIRPFATSALSRDTMLGGSTSFATAGLVFGGPVGAVGGAVLGGAYGMLNPGFGNIPGYRQEERDLTAQLDKVRYKKASDLYNLTGSIDAKKEMERTLTYQYNNSDNINSIYSAMPKHERGFVRKFAQLGTLEERQRVMEIIPEYAKPALLSAWGGNTEHLDSGKDVMESYDVPNENWKGWNANIKTDDIAVKMFDRAGLDAADVNLGWHDQLRRMRYSPGIPDSFSSSVGNSRDIASEVKNIVQSIVPGAQITVVKSNSPGITVSIV
jgi:hypothetical protein